MSERSDLEAACRRLESRHAHGRLVWREWGTGTPVVLLHGSFGAWSHWVRNIPVLAERHRVIAADLPGMGDSDSPPESFDPASLGAILAEGVDQLPALGRTFHLVGFSFGGILGGQLVLRRHDRVRSFTVIGSAGLGLKLNDWPALAQPRGSMTEVELREVHRRNLAIMMIHDPARIDPLAIEIQSINTRRARIRSGGIPHGDSLARALRAILTPVHGIWGERDSTVGPYLADREALFRALPHCRSFERVAGAGHWVAYERPEVVNRLLLGIFAH